MRRFDVVSIGSDFCGSVCIAEPRVQIRNGRALCERLSPRFVRLRLVYRGSGERSPAIARWLCGYALRRSDQNTKAHVSAIEQGIGQVVDFDNTRGVETPLGSGGSFPCCPAGLPAATLSGPSGRTVNQLTNFRNLDVGSTGQAVYSGPT